MSFKKYFMIIGFVFLFVGIFLIISSEKVSADAYSDSLAEAILCDPDLLVSSSYHDEDDSGNRQSGIFESLGVMQPTNGSDFVILSTGIAGGYPVTTYGLNPGDERGSWFRGGETGSPIDRAVLTMQLQVPPLAQYLKYDVRFLSSEAPEWIGDGYNDNLVIEVESSQGDTTFDELDVDSNLFREESRDLVGTGFDIFALDGNPTARDTVTTTIGSADDAGATILWAIEDVHPVLGPEIITVTISIEDYGDNRYDSAVFLDNFRFEEEADVSLEVTKEVKNINGEIINEIDTGEIVKYDIYIKNGGDIELSDTYMIDNISEHLTFIPGTLDPDYGSAQYHSDPNGDYITWEGDIPPGTPGNYVKIEFQATVNEDVENGTIISNRASVKWDTNNDGILDIWENSNIVNVTAICFEVPEYVLEDFTDDEPGGNASEMYLNRPWFETQSETDTKSAFQVVSGYEYDTDNSFKTKLRSSIGKLTWYYTLDEIEAEMSWWEIMLACGNASEQADLLLDFKDTNNNDIFRIKLEYLPLGSEKTTDWLLKPYYYGSGNWIPIIDGFIYNGWYKLRFEINGSNLVDYIIEKQSGERFQVVTAEKLEGSFSSFSKVEWYSNSEPIVCPIFFWDEHRVGLT
jgi:uncharacterized repeat protein (TIGR01451 family)